MRPALTLLLATALSVPGPARGQCNMAPAFRQPDERGTRSVPVWSGGSAMLFGSGLAVNTDGTRRSYSLSDFWGEDHALNNLCNAMSDRCDGLSSEQKRQRRILTQRAAANGWPADLLEQTRLSPAIIPMRGGRPCPEVDGYLVSATSLQRRNIVNLCDLANYVDALQVPALVLPGRAERRVPTRFEVHGAGVGDLVVAANRDGTRLVYGVVGDTGPARDLGEASIAMNAALLGRTERLENYNHVRGYNRNGHDYRGRGLAVQFAYILIFPGTRDRDRPFMEAPRIEAAARARFEQWGGPARLARCRGEYSAR